MLRRLCCPATPRASVAPGLSFAPRVRWPATLKPSFLIPLDHPSLPGHFPGRPLVPGVVVLDQVLDAIDAAHARLGLAPPRALRLPQVKFLQPLLPGQPAHIELQRVEGEAVRWRFRVLHQAGVLASGEVVVGNATHATAPETATPASTPPDAVNLSPAP